MTTWTGVEVALRELEAAIPPRWQFGALELSADGRRWRVSLRGERGASHSEQAADPVLAVRTCTEWVRKEFHRAGQQLEMPALPEPPDGWAIPEGYTAELRVPPAHCRSCGAEVAWATTPKGHRMPLDRDGTSHFATCPQASDWRRRAS